MIRVFVSIYASNLFVNLHGILLCLALRKFMALSRRFLLNFLSYSGQVSLRGILPTFLPCVNIIFGQCIT